MSVPHRPRGIHRPRWLRPRLVALAALQSLLQESGTSAAPPAPLCPAASPTSVVRAYYHALDQHRPAAAKACLTRHYLTRLTKVLHVVDPDWENVTAAQVV